jgi:hypothetical protein
MSRWQYKIVVERIPRAETISSPHQDSEQERILNSYGRDGWELVSVILEQYRRETDPLSVYGYLFFRYYFKKMTEENTEEQSLSSKD